MHDLYLSTVIFNALSTLVLIGVCSVLAVHDPLRRRTARRYSVISRFPEPIVLKPIGARKLPSQPPADDAERAEAA